MEIICKECGWKGDFSKLFIRREVRGNQFVTIMSCPQCDMRNIERTKKWRVEVFVDGESVLSIEDDSLAGVDNIQDHAGTVRKCAKHLLSFIGEEWKP